MFRRTRWAMLATLAVGAFALAAGTASGRGFAPSLTGRMWSWLDWFRMDRAVRARIAENQRAAGENARAAAERAAGFRLSPDEKRELVDGFYRAFERKQEFLDALAQAPPADRLQTETLEATVSPMERPLGLDPRGRIRSVSVENRGAAPTTVRLRLTGRAGDAPVADVERLTEVLLLRTQTGLSDESLAFTLWKTVRDNYAYSYSSPGDELWTEEGFLRGYGYGLCGNAARVLAGLATSAGLDSRVLCLSTPEGGAHVVTEIAYRGRWHLYDPTAGCFFLKDLGAGYYRVADLEDIRQDPGLIARTIEPHGTVPILDLPPDDLARFLVDAKVEYKPSDPPPAVRDLPRLLEFVSPLDLLHVNRGGPMTVALSTDGPFAGAGDLAVMPVRFEQTLEPGDRVEYTNIPWGKPFIPAGAGQTAPQYYANGRLLTPIARGRTVACRFAITDIDCPSERVRDALRVSFDGGRTWTSLADREALRRDLAVWPRHAYQVEANREADLAGETLETTFALSPFDLGDGLCRSLSLDAGSDQPHLRVDVRAEMPDAVR